jgi:exosortase A
MTSQKNTNVNIRIRFNLLLAFFFGTIFIVYSSTFISISKDWLDFGNAYGHGFLILATVIYILYDDRDKFIASFGQPYPLFLLMSFVLSCIWFIAHFLDIQIIQQTLLPILILSSCGAVFGIKLFRQLIFLITLIYFSIPIWGYLTEPLQVIATFIVGKAVYFVGIPTHITGYYVDIPFGRFEIAGGCAGVRYLTAGMTIALLYAYWYGSSTKEKVSLFSLGIFMALLSNWLRIFSIIVIGHVTEMKSPLVKDHDTFGWVLFTIMLVLFFIIGNKINRNSQRTSQLGNSSQLTNKTQFIVLKSHFHTLVILFIATFATPLLGTFYLTEFPPTYDLRQNELAAPNWQVIQLNQNNWRPHFFGASTEEQLSFSNIQNNEINLFFYAYPNENQKDGELVNYNNKIADPDLWHLAREQSIQIALNNEHFAINESIITDRKTGSKKLVYSWYMFNGEFTKSGFKAKLLKLKAFISRPTRPPALIAYSINCSKKCDNERLILQQFIKDTAQQIR